MEHREATHPVSGDQTLAVSTNKKLKVTWAPIHTPEDWRKLTNKLSFFLFI